MKKILILILSMSLFSCEKDVLTPISISPQTTVSTPTVTPTVYYKVVIENYNPTKKIVGFYIDGVLQKLDVGTYPVGYNQKVYAKNHSPICENVYFPKGCKTLISIEYSDGGWFNEVKINRFKNGRAVQGIDGIAGNAKGSYFIWNAVPPNSSTIGVKWNGQGVRPSNDVWNDKIEIIAK